MISGAFHGINAYRIGVTPQPLWYNTMDLWGGSSLS